MGGRQINEGSGEAFLVDLNRCSPVGSPPRYDFKIALKHLLG